MRYTSAEANKLLRKLKNEEDFILVNEAKAKQFNAAVGEDVEDVRPVYNFADTCKELEAVQKKIRTVKHAIALFNVQTRIGDETIDEVLVRLPELKSRQITLERMAKMQPKTRSDTFGSGKAAVIDYLYANFDIDEVKAEYDRVSNEIARLQLELDKANSTILFEIDM